MPYKAEISRTTPSAILILIDHSTSMREPADNQGTSKAQMVADAVNGLLQSLLSKCTKADGIRDYFYVGAIGYGGGEAGPIFQGVLAQKELIPISLIGNYALRVESREKQVIGRDGKASARKINFPIWLEPRALGDTPMCAALAMAKQYLRNWLLVNHACFPPIIINISDGEASDGDPLKSAEEVMSLSSSDGNVLLFNVFVSGSSNKRPIEYPDNEDLLGDRHARMLFSMSSPLTSYMQRTLSADGYKVTSASRGFVYNADFNSVIRFLDIGTRPSLMR